MRKGDFEESCELRPKNLSFYNYVHPRPEWAVREVSKCNNTAGAPVGRQSPHPHAARRTPHGELMN